jgi:hypothetical protein
MKEQKAGKVTAELKKMNKKILLSLIAGLIFFSFASLVPAYDYGGCVGCYGYYGNNIDSYSFHSQRTSGSYGFLTQSQTDYNRASVTLPDGTRERRLTYTTVTRETPQYASYYGYPNYGGYQGYNSPYAYGNNYNNGYYGDGYYGNNNYNNGYYGNNYYGSPSGYY